MTTAPATKKSIFDRPIKPYVNPYLGGAVLGVVLFLAFFLTGMGSVLRCDNPYRCSGCRRHQHRQHVDNTPYLLKMAGGDKNPFDDWIIPVFFGALLGGFASGFFGGRLKFETRKGPRITNRTRWFWRFLVARSSCMARAWRAAVPPARRSQAERPWRQAPGW